MAGFTLERRSETPLARQIYMHIRKEILNGGLKEDSALVSTRALAGQMGVSRNTVSEAYDMLIAEGYILSSKGAASRVAKGVQIEGAAKAESQQSENKPKSYTADFKTGQPDLGAFPHKQWLNSVANAMKTLPTTELSYTGPQGMLSLRQEISAWMYRSHMLSIDPGDIFITAGATQALYLLAELLLAEQKKIIMEDPCHMGMLRVLQTKGALIEPVPADEHGIRTDRICGEGAGAVYVTPSHQFPLGGILPAERRASLIRQARQHGFYIIEDDYDSEYRYGGMSISPLYAMDPEKVIYVGTFSKILFPALRIGYILLPRPLQQQWRRLRTCADVQNPPLGQAALADFLHTRKMDRHIYNMKKLYAQRRSCLLETLKNTFGQSCTFFGDSAGLHIVAQFPGACFDEAFRKSAAAAGLKIMPLSLHCIRECSHADKLLLGYGHLEPGKIRSGVKLLHRHMVSAGVWPEK